MSKTETNATPKTPKPKPHRLSPGARGRLTLIGGTAIDNRTRIEGRPGQSRKVTLPHVPFLDGKDDGDE